MFSNFFKEVLNVMSKKRCFACDFLRKYSNFDSKSNKQTNFIKFKHMQLLQICKFFRYNSLLSLVIYLYYIDEKSTKLFYNILLSMRFFTYFCCRLFNFAKTNVLALIFFSIIFVKINRLFFDSSMQCFQINLVARSIQVFV